MPETQLASMFIGSADDGDDIDRGRPSDGNMIHIVNPQTNEILDYITLDKIIEDTHKKSLESYLETYDAIVLGGNDFSYDKHLEKRNHIIIPDEDGTYQEFILFEVDKYRDTEGRKTHFYAHATYLELKKAKVIYPTRREGFTLSQHAGWALNDTGWRVGIVESEGVRTFNIENHTNPYEFIKRLANEFEVEIRFRVEHDGRRITARYVDFLERIGDWKGREVEFGRDLDSIRRIEKQDIVTALLGLGPEREDGTRLEVLVEDEEALQRWGRVDEHGNLHHLIEPYEIQSDRQEMTEEEARQYTRTALDKRINTQVTYETTILDLEEVPGLEHEKIRFGDTIRIKDTYFNPPLYLEARVFEIERSIKNKAKKDIKLGDYVEYTEEEVDAIWNQLRNEIRRRLDRMAIVSITSTAGNIFKNAQGETQLTARTFVNGAERDEDGTLYDYQWMRFDKDGNHDTDFYAEGKTITVKASDIDEKATYRVLVAYELEVISTAEITISNVFDGEDGEPGPPGPKGEDGKTFYTWIKYADTPTSGMSDSPEGKEYIGIAYNKETPTPSTNYDDYIWAKFKGEQGIPGPPGEDGQPTYTWVKYADDEHGNGMSDSPDGKLYIGLAFNKTTPEESNNPADYTWSLMPQNIEIGGRNLARLDVFEGWVDGYERNGYVFTLDTDSGRAGISINESIFQEGENYVLSFKIKKISGDITTVAGHQTAFSTKAIFLDGEKFDTRWSVGVPYPNDTNVHEIKVHLEAVDLSVTDPKLYIQPNRSHYDYSYVCQIWDIQVEKGDKATDWTPAPEDVQEQIDEAKQEAEEARQEAQQAQTTADGKNTVFRQSSQPPTTGRKIGDVWFDTSRDNLMHVFNGTQWVEAKWGEQSIVANSITANHIKSLVGLNVNDQFIVDSQGNVKFAGSLEGASGTFKGVVQGGEIIQRSGDNYIKLSDRKLESVVYSQSQNLTQGVEIFTNNIVLYTHSGKPNTTTKVTGINLDSRGLSFKFDPESPYFDEAGIYGTYDPFNNETHLALDFNRVSSGGQLTLYNRGVSNGLALGGVSGDHYIVGHTNTGAFHIYPHRESGENIFTIRSHVNRSSYRNDFWIDSNGDTYTNRDLRVETGNIWGKGLWDITTSNSANARIGTAGSGGYSRFLRSTSSKRYKVFIEDANVDPYKILNLKPKSWIDKGEYERNGNSTEGLTRHYGIIAEDMEEIGLPEYVEYHNGKVENIVERAWTLLIPIVKDLNDEVKNIKERLERLENEGN